MALTLRLFATLGWLQGGKERQPERTGASERASERIKINDEEAMAPSLNSALSSFLWYSGKRRGYHASRRLCIRI